MLLFSLDFFNETLLEWGKNILSCKIPSNYTLWSLTKELGEMFDVKRRFYFKFHYLMVTFALNMILFCFFDADRLFVQLKANTTDRQ